MTRNIIYLDNNATTSLDPRVADRIAKEWTLGPANPSSQHQLGQRARNRLDEAIEAIGRCLGCRLDQPGGPRLILTSGGTESNNLALRGIGHAGPLVVSQVEHPSVLATALEMQTQGRDVRFLGVDDHGQVQLDQLEGLIEQEGIRASLVSIMSANNETGVVQPIAEAAKICHRLGVPLHVDTTQTIGKQVIHLGREYPGVSAVTFTAHKFHGPVGVGALWLAAGVDVKAIIRGGEQQLDTRPGTEPVALAVGMAQALQFAQNECEQSYPHTTKLRDRLELGLLAGHAELVVQGIKHPRLPNTTCVSFVGTDRQSLLMSLDMAGIAASSGSACSSGSSPPSHVLTAMKRPEAEIRSAIRFAVSKFSTVEEIDEAIERISQCYLRLRRKSDVDNS
ncbi:Cysteine desulfurase [Rubripirellula amarantea]|uniref:Cysteine desulfurase n=1 Tax=Rubripirellula amarantea TaxID=2527999 RepID=A0A5C5WSK5_9BACT|nr:cysteine desulfurase family protein [Rubripirellula amarantea]TWT53498.1 Cysteine desulfurase [Rubripirellula amarantea]